MSTERTLLLAAVGCGLGLALLSGCGGGVATPPATPPPTPRATPAPVTLSDLHFDATIASTCSDPSHEPQVVQLAPGTDGRRWVHPRCFPRYFEQDTTANWNTEDGRPLPIMGRTCGPFNVLVVFEDNAENRALLAQSLTFNDSNLRDRLQALFDSFQDAQIAVSHVVANPSGSLPVSFSFDVVVTTAPVTDWPPYARRTGSSSAPGGPNGSWWGAGFYEPYDVGQRFDEYDAVILLHELGQAWAWGVQHWPAEHPLFFQGGTGYVLHIDPSQLHTPGLIGHELLYRSMPETLAQYVFGPYTTETRDGVVYNVTPIYNPRTGENIQAALRADPVVHYYSGWRDIDRDGVTDCLDPSITPTAENVDGDLVPDHFDPDLNANNSAYFWKPAE